MTGRRSTEGECERDKEIKKKYTSAKKVQIE